MKIIGLFYTFLFVQFIGCLYAQESANDAHPTITSKTILLQKDVSTKSIPVKQIQNKKNNSLSTDNESSDTLGNLDFIDIDNPDTSLDDNELNTIDTTKQGMKQNETGNIPNDDAFDKLIGLENDTTTAKSVQTTILLSEKEIQDLRLKLYTGPADVLLLKNGKTVEGVIREKTDDIITIETENGLDVFDLNDVEFVDEISEKNRFNVLHIIETLQEYNKRKKLKTWEKTKAELSRKTAQAAVTKKQLSIASGQHTPNLFTLTQTRLAEILKDFSQFPPNYWRYYQQRSDAIKTLLQLKRLMRHAHPAFKPIIKLYITAFEYKKKELSESEGSSLRQQYQSTYKDRFQMAEIRRLTPFEEQ